MARRDTAKARLVEGAISQTLTSPGWTGAGDDRARARVLAAAILEALDASTPTALAKAYARVLRDRRIRDAFTGDNNRELARRFDLDVRQVRRIVRARGRRN